MAAGGHQTSFAAGDRAKRCGLLFYRGSWTSPCKICAPGAAFCIENRGTLAGLRPCLCALESGRPCCVGSDRGGCYSPIIHLQQTNGQQSAHLPFTPEQNAAGIIRPRAVLEAIKAAYAAPEDPNMPRRCTEIYLTLELFSGTTSIMEDVLRDLEKSVAYWRAIIPQDGKPLDCSL